MGRIGGLLRRCVDLLFKSAVFLPRVKGRDANLITLILLNSLKNYLDDGLREGYFE